MRKLIKKYVIKNVDDVEYLSTSDGGNRSWQPIITRARLFDSEDSAEQEILDGNGSYKGGLGNGNYIIEKIYVKSGEKED